MVGKLRLTQKDAMGMPQVTFSPPGRASYPPACWGCVFTGMPRGAADCNQRCPESPNSASLPCPVTQDPSAWVPHSLRRHKWLSLGVLAIAELTTPKDLRRTRGSVGIGIWPQTPPYHPSKASVEEGMAAHNCPLAGRVL